MTPFFPLLTLLLCQQPHLGLERYAVDPAASTIGFDGTSSIHDFTGTSHAAAGEIHVDFSRLADTVGGSVRTRVDAIRTGEDGRDENMREDLEAERFPEMIFLFDSLEGGNGRTGTFTVRGRFLIHGVARERSFPVQVSEEDGGLRVQGRVRFRMTDHGVTPHSVLGVIKVGDEVEAWFDLLLRPVSGVSVDARTRVLHVAETQTGAGGQTRSVQSEERFWNTGTAWLWDRGTSWVIGGGGGPRLADLQKATVAAVADPCEAAFAESRARLTSLQAKLAKLPPARKAKLAPRLQGTIDRLRASLADAPPAGEAAQLERDGDRLTIRIGDQVWLQASGFTGDLPFLGSLRVLPGIPAALHSVLPTIQGLPTHLELRTATPAGIRLLRFDAAEPCSARLPDWALRPDSWLPVAKP